VRAFFSNIPHVGETGKSDPGRAFLVPGILLMTIVALALRIALLDHSTWDLVGFSLPVLDRIRGEGFWAAIARQFSMDEYAPFYSYAIAIADAILPTGTDGKTVIKSISILFDFVAATTVFALARLRWHDSRRAVGAYAALLFAPTVVLNGAYWGQSDIVYTAFLLACFYFVVRQASVWAMVCFGLACAFKPQGAWLGPFILMLVLRRRIRWWQLLLVPAIYCVMALPALYAGRPWLELATIYLTSASTLPRSLNGHTANLYLFLDYFFGRLSLWPEGIPLIAKLGMVLTAAVASLFAWQASRGPLDSHSENMIMAALVSVLIMPQCLPHMHERYFFPADVFAIVLGVWNPAYWWVAALMQFNSFVTYIHFLWGLQLMAQPVPPWMASFGFTNNLQPVTGLVAVASITNAALLLLLWRDLIGKLKRPTQTGRLEVSV
jgi:Gpi18-like mannosyltransferase